MSHCSSFSMTFRDKRVLYRAMRNLGYNPENRVWVEYRNQFAKKLQVAENVIGKLLTGTIENLNLFFIETEDGLVPYFESDFLSPDELQRRGGQYLSTLRIEYLRCAVHAMADQVRANGNAVTITEESHLSQTSFVLTIGAANQTLRVAVDQDGNVEEKVEGVAGRSCLDFTANLESKLTTYNAVQRVWTHEYDATIEDQQIQILRLE